MRSPLLKKLCAVCFGLALCGLLDRVAAQLSVGPSGLPAQAFATAPAASEVSTLNVLPFSSGAVTTGSQLDALVQTNVSATIVNALASTASVPPGVSGNAQWNATGLWLQTRPTGNTYTLLMATLRNDTGSNVSALTVSYNLGALVTAGASILEEVPGHRAYFSQTGATGTWVHIPGFDSAASDSAGPKSAILNLGNWAPSANLYLLWADDNAAAGTSGPTQEGGYTIDDLAVAATPVSPLPSIITQPLAQSVAPGSPVTLSVTASGNNPLAYQWLKNSNVIAGATSSTYTINNTVLGDQGFYSVRVTNTFGSTTSSNAFLTVACAAPVAIVSQPGNQSLNSGGTIGITATAAGTQPITYQWYRSGVALAGATSATFTKANAQSSDSGLYYVVASNCGGPVSSAKAVVSVSDTPFVLVGLTNQVWKYNQSGTDLGTAWQAAGYNDASWSSGRGIMAVEDNATIAPLINTPLSLTNPSWRTITYYFRTQFTVTNDPSVISLVASNYFDDGAVVYLNGVEAFRFNMPAGDISYSTVATAANPLGEGVAIISNIPPGLVISGVNQLAVEVHQVNATSSDVVFGCALFMEFIPPGPPDFVVQPADLGTPRGVSGKFTASVPSAEAIQFQWFHAGARLLNETNNTLLLTNVQDFDSGEYLLSASNSYGAVTSRVAYLYLTDGPEHLRLLEFTNLWRYDASGSSVSGAWASPSFDDSAWPAGRGVLLQTPLADFPETTNTYLPLTNGLGSSIGTYYFRTHFTVPAGVTNLCLVTSNLLDDAAVFYLNGVEATRLRIQSAGNSTTMFSSPSSGRAYEVLQFPGVNLNATNNVFAVAVFQISPGNSDIVFGMNMLGYARGSAPPVTIAPLSSQNKAEGEPVGFAANVFGSVPMRYQWFRDGSAVSGATNAQFTLHEAHPSHAGSYFFIASNQSGSLTSVVATLTVLKDLTPPSLLMAYITNGQSGVVVVFSEPVTESSATNLANYTLSGGAHVWSAQLMAPNQVLLLTSQLDVQLGYTLAVAGLLDHADSPNVLASGSAVRVRPDILRVATGLLNVQTVFIILMENERWSAIKGNTNLPYLNSLLPQASYCERYFGHNNTHPSEPNYIWLEAGDDFGFNSDAGPVFHRIASTNHLATQLFNAGVEWRGYMEDLPYGSTGVTDAGEYLGRHNPFAFFDDVTGNYDYCTNHVRPYAEFAGDLAAGRIGRYNFITPNATNDMHSWAPGSTSRTKQGDDWLARELPQILNSAAFSNNGAVFITWDENDFSPDFPIGMIVLSPLAKGNGHASRLFYDHSSTLRTMQDIFGVRPYLGDAANVSPLNDLFQELSLRIAPSNGVAGVWLDNVLPGRTNYVQASSNLVHWTTISTNTAMNAVFVPDPDAKDSPQRFYRAIEQP